MRVELLQADEAPLAASAAGDAAGFARALDSVGALLDGANAAEDDYANGSGSLQRAVYQRAQADVALSIATAAAQRAAQALSSILNTQI